MTPEAQRMHDEMAAVNEYLVVDVAGATKQIALLTVKMREFEKTVSEILLSDSVMFDSIFNSSYSDEHKTACVSSFIGIDGQRIMASPDSGESVAFIQKIMLHTTLSDLYNIVRYACDMSRREFCLSWLMMNEGGKLGNLLASATQHHNKLTAQMAESIRKKNEHHEGSYFDFMLKLEDPASGTEEFADEEKN